MKISFFSLIIFVLLSGSAFPALCPKGDLNGDCKVDFEDIKSFAEQWLNAGGCSHPGCPDFDGINGINFSDYSVLASNWCEAGIPLVINEFMASNNSDSGISDPQGDYDDWLEIYNFGETAVDIGGMYLTDNFSSPTKWQIPQSTIVEANGFVLFWADRDIEDGPQHADFKLSADGEEVGLFLDADTMVDGIIFGEQTANISYGRYPDASDNLRFFTTPTPLASNSGVYVDFIEDVEFSHQRGFCEDSFNLTMATATEGAQIYYTTDGSKPIQNEAPSATSTEYTGAVTVSSTACIRAAAVKTGWMPSRTTTNTYIFNASDEIKSLPVVSIVGDEYESLYEPNGIMAIVGGTYVNGVWTSGGAGTYNNPIHRGIEYERPVSFEFVDLQTGIDYQSDCGIRVHGSDYTRPRYTRGEDWSCNTNKFSFNLFFRSEYGDNFLESPLFPFIDVERYDSIVLRAGHNDICSPFVKDEWARRLFMEMGAAQLTGKFATLFINGHYKYYYNPCGRLDEEFFQEWFDTDDSFDLIDQSGVRDGDTIAWDNLISYATSHNLADMDNYEYVAGMLDIKEFIDYLILEIHIGNFDWPGNNWAVYREKRNGAKFGFAVWDAEGLAETWIFGNNCEECYKTAFEDFPTWSNTPGLNHMTDPLSRLYRALKANVEFRQLFTDRIHKLFHNGGALSESHLAAKWWEVYNQVSDLLPYQSTFVPDTFLPVRENYSMSAFEENSLYNRSLGAPVFNVNGSYQYGGYISSSDTITIIDPCSAGTIYYTLDGTDPRLPAQSEASTGTVLVSDDSQKKAVVPAGDIGITWRGGSEPYDDSAWTSGTSGVGYERGSGYEPYIGIDVNSEMYNENTTCYVRIPFTVDGGELADYENLTLRTRYDDGFVAYINGSEVYRVNAPTTVQWNSAASSDHEASSSWDYYDISDHIGDLQAGDNILAVHGLNISTTSSDFLVSVELEASNGGGSYEPSVAPGAIEYTGGFNLDKSTDLKSRVYKDSTDEWSALNEAVYGIEAVADSLRITEIMYHPQDTDDPNDPNEEYIELKNIGASPINLNLVRFTNGIDFVFGPNSLGAGQYILVVKDVNAFEAEYGASRPVAGQYTGSLDNSGEKIELEDAMGTTILSFNYSDDWRPVTDGDGYSLTIINPAADANSWDEKDSWRSSAYVNGSPGWDDSGIVPNPGDIVINEVMSHTDIAPNDWVELHNTTASPIDISGWYLSDKESDLTKYEFQPGTVVDANGYLVVSEDANFGDSAGDPGKHTAFALSKNGETVCLSSALDSNGLLTGLRQQQDFGASPTGVSFGRYYKSSTNNFDFVAMDYNTPGQANAGPKVGPIVISEIMYNPDWPAGGSYENDQYEYVKLYNNSSWPVTLYDYTLSEPWKFTDGIDYTFPASPNEVTIAAGQSILIVKNPAAFSWRYPTIPSSKIFGPYSSNLSNGGESVQLGRPGEEYILVDRVDYSDGSHPQDCPGGVDLWPAEADGDGSSLVRIDPNLYGNDPNNWQEACCDPPLPEPPVGDLKVDYQIDFCDFAVLGQAWFSSNGDDNWNQACNLESEDEIIDEQDLGVLVGCWLE